MGDNILGQAVLVLTVLKVGPELGSSSHHPERKPFPCPRGLGGLHQCCPPLTPGKFLYL